MSGQQITIFALLFIVLLLFVWGRWRYDVVAVCALLAAVITGLVPPEEAFNGFGHPAVITVAAVLMVSQGLMNVGLVDRLARLVARSGNGLLTQMLVLIGLVIVSSAFMNNVGALALFMPVAIRLARKSERSPSVYLMPLAFGSLLGGMMTQIGTPPNIIVSLIRASHNGGTSFTMFDFFPVGSLISAAGFVFIVLIGWRLLPYRKGQASREGFFQIHDYISEVLIPDDSDMVGKTVQDLETAAEGEWLIVAHYRNEQKMAAPSPHRALQAGDSFMVRSSAEKLKEVVDAHKLKIAEEGKRDEADIRSDEVDVVEATVTPRSALINRTVRTVRLRSRYNINLLALSRTGGRISVTLENVHLRAGDVLLLQGSPDNLQNVMPLLGLLPLAERNIRIGQPQKAAAGMFVFSAAIILAALGYLPVQITFVAAAAAMVLLGFLPLGNLYTAVDWPVIVLLGAMLPVSTALESTGGAQLLADLFLVRAGTMAPTITVGLLLLLTMLLSNVINNAAAALLMAPLAIGIAQGLNAAMDPFLMAVAIGASSAFLTPIGHQSNTLVLGPGGYRFSDYWRLGLPLSILILVLSIPLILRFWPL